MRTYRRPRFTIGISALGLALVLAEAPRAMAEVPCPQTGWTLQSVDSEQAPSNSATKAFDGNPATVWTTAWTPTPAPLPHEIVINLGSVCILGEFRLTPWLGAPYGRIGRYEFSVSLDASDWGAPVASGTFANDATTKIVPFVVKTGQYVRLRALSALEGAPFTTVAELQVIAFVGVSEQGFLGYFSGSLFQGSPTPCLNGGAAYAAGDPLGISYSCNGLDGAPGAGAKFVDYFEGAANGCPNGGSIYSAGNPPVTTYVCDGATGATGPPGPAGPGTGFCFSDTSGDRYIDCGNGTVTDTRTGLIWLRQANCFFLEDEDWLSAKTEVANLKDGTCGLTDGSQRGDWRLPTDDEWSDAMDRAKVACPSLPGWPNDAGTGCWESGAAGSSFTGVVVNGLGNVFWSSSIDHQDDRTVVTNVWAAALASTDLFSRAKSTHFRAWPVRGGPR